MSDPTDQPADPSLTPEQERDVRRMLVDARHADPVPADVAARLDRVLAELAAGEHASPSPVVDLASHRRRRVTTLLVAAAAVVAVGVGIGQVLPSGSDDAATSSDSTMSGADPRSLGEDAAGGSHDQVAPEPATGSAPAYALSRPARVSEQGFSSDVRRLRSRVVDRASASAAQGKLRGLRNGEARLDGPAGFSCTPADWGVGTFLPVRYDGDPGVLVLRPTSGDTQVVDLFSCGSSVVVRSITLPAR